ncbi:MAG TPA: hypothetical protein DEP69_02410, partial [Acidimicrobiaceae bacterium]|nr:hypothetical protein [Acidimicrobiaceae bacterium]
VVRVSNVDEEGTVTVSPSAAPRVGGVLRASLADPDSPAGDFAGLSWQWSSKTSAGVWEPIGGAASASYTPTDAVGGRTLRATASYADGQGSGKTAVSAETVSVGVVPAAPSDLTAVAMPGGTIRLEWSGPTGAGSSSVTGYQYNQSTTGTFSDDGWMDIGVGATVRIYRVAGLPLGVLHYFVVRAVNSAGAGAPSDRASATPATHTGLVGVAPAAPSDLTAVAMPGGTIRLEWSGPTGAGSSSVTGYQYNQSTTGTFSDDGWMDIGVGATVRIYRVAGLPLGVLHYFVIRAVNRAGAGPASAQVSATPAPPNAAPTVSGSAAPSFAEGGSGVVAAYAAADEATADADIDWTLSGADAALFDIAGGELRFRSAPDYENAGDADGDNVYEVVITVTDDADDPLSGELAVVVRVSNVDEPGVVTITITPLSTPRVGVRLSASLVDPDGLVAGTTWQWRSSTNGADYTDIASATAVTYTVQSSDAGRTLRATAFYADAQGSGKTAVSAETLPVVVVPAAPTLTAVATAVGTIRLEWSGPADNGGSPVSGFEYNRSTTGAFSDDGWMSLSATSTSLRVDGLIPDVLYYFVVRARNLAGAGPASDPASATPTPPDATPVVSGDTEPSFAEDGGGVVATYTVADDATADADIVWSLDGVDAARFDIAGGVLTFTTAPDYENPGDAGGDNVYNVVITATDDGDLPLSDELTVTVTVTNVEEAGVVTITPSDVPQVGVRLTASLTDPDGGVEGITWQWQAGGTVVGAAAAYTVAPDDAGRTLRATAFYTDGQGSGKTAALATAAVPAVPPGAPAGLQATPGDESVSLAWSEPADLGGEPVERYEYRVREGSGSFGTWVDVGTATTALVSELTGGTTYYFVVRAVNRAGAGPETTAVLATPAPPNAAPTVSGSAAPSFAEGDSGVVAAYTASDDATADGDIVWSLDGVDAARFDIAGGVLRFRAPPDYESADDADGDNVYEITLVAEDNDPDDSETARYPVTVSVVNVDESGTAEVTPQTAPLSGTPLAATLTGDPDGGVAGTTWQWSSKTAAGVWEPIGGATSASYTPTDAVGGRTLRATASYADAQGPGKTAVSAETLPVLVAPAASTLTAVATTVGTIRLEWSEPADNGGSSITGYQYNQSTTGIFSDDRWMDIGGGAVATGRIVAGLANGTRYYFVVRARNRAGAGAPSNRASATTAAKPGPVSDLTAGNVVRSEGGTFASLDLSWKAPADDGFPILRYEYRFASGGAPLPDTWKTISGGATTTNIIVTGLGVGLTYSFEVRAVNDIGAGDGRRTSVTTVVPPSSVRTLTATAGVESVSLAWSEPADLGGEPVERYEYNKSETSGSFDSNDWTTIPGGDPTAAAAVVSGLTGGMTYYFVVRAVNSAGAGPETTAVSATPASPNAAPVVSGDTEPGFAEGGGGVVATYTVDDDATADD